MNLKSELFSDPDVSTHKDVNGISIKAGDKLLADSNSVFYVHRERGRFVVATEKDLSNPNTQKIHLNLFVMLSQKIEICTTQ
jgi:hypothetical protein